MKRLIIILTLFFAFLNYAAAAEVKNVTKDYKILTKDSFTIAATLEYPKVKGKKEYQTVVLLHSLGYSSEWWGNLPSALLKKGYAVLLIDFRGHGKSVYNSKLARVSWTNLTNKAYAKYPEDVLTVINYVKSENKRVFFNNWALVGSDIGSVTGVYVANQISNKPKTIVMLSPVVEAKGLYMPIKLAELNNIDILAITGYNDVTGKKAVSYLKKFAQSTFAQYTAESNLSGMLMFKNDTSLDNVITSWISEYLK